VLLIIQQREGGRIDPLREHLVAELLGQPVVHARKLGAMDHRAARHVRQAILRLLLEQQLHRDDPVAARRRLPAGLTPQPQQIALKHRAEEQPGCKHLGRSSGHPLAELSITPT
jgi:hypothetical protein